MQASVLIIPLPQLHTNTDCKVAYAPNLALLLTRTWPLGFNHASHNRYHNQKFSLSLFV